MNTKIIAILALAVSIIALGVGIAPYIKMPTQNYTYPHNTKLSLYQGGTIFSMDITNKNNITLYNCVIIFRVENPIIHIYTYQLGTMTPNSTVKFSIPQTDIPQPSYPNIKEQLAYGFTP